MTRLLTGAAKRLCGSDARREILLRYARTGPSGGLSRCPDPRFEGRSKVIFETSGKARLAAKALAEHAANLRFDVYPHGRHWHLTKRRVQES